jgi:DNA primase
VPRYAVDSRDKVRDAVDMIDLVGTKTELKRAGASRYEGLCPFHDERTPSFGIDPSQKLFHCFGCGKGGDCFTFVEESEGVDFKGALEWLAQRYNVELEVEDEDPKAAARRMERERLLELLERATSFYVRHLWESDEAKGAREYLQSRGLEEATLREFRVGYAPSAWDTLLVAGKKQGFTNNELFESGLAVRAKQEGRVYDRFRRRIMFPLADRRGRVLGFGARALGADQQPKYLNSPEGAVFHKGRQVYAADIARAPSAKADQVIVCEGYTDVLAMHQAGLKNSVGIMGTAMTPQQLDELSGLAHTILLALDADSAGQKAMMRAAKVAQGKRIELRVVPLPAGRDPAEIVIEDGAKAAQKLVDESVPFVRFQVERALANADLTDAEGKDRVIEELKPVFATIPPSAMREDLLKAVTAATELAPAMVSSWLPAPGAPVEPARRIAGERPASNGGSRAAGADPTRRAERAFLAAALAEPAAGADALEQAADDLFSSDVTRRAVAHLRENIETPGENLPADDDELSALIAALVAAASKMDGSRDTVQGQLRELLIAHERHLMAVDMREGNPGVADRRKRIDEWARERDQFIGGTMEASKRTDA